MSAPTDGHVRVSRVGDSHHSRGGGRASWVRARVPSFAAEIIDGGRAGRYSVIYRDPRLGPELRALVATRVSALAMSEVR